VGKAPDEIRAEIEQTRAELTTDVDMLAEKVSPARVVERRVDATKQAVTDLKEKVMGKASDVTSSAGDKTSGLTGGVSSAASSAGQTVSSTPQQVKQKAQGNPMAAGLVAFGMGWLASSLFPATQAEQQMAETLKEKAKPLAEPVKSELSSVAAEMKDNLAQPVQEAVSSVKETATDAASSVKDTATLSAMDVKDHAQEAAGTVQDHATDSAATVKGQASSSAATVKDAGSSPSPGSSGGSTSTYPLYDDDPLGAGTTGAGQDETFTVPPSPYGQGNESDRPGGGTTY
jgi:gas vesicle protein